MSDDDDIRKILSNVANKCGTKSWTYDTENLDKKILNFFGSLIPVTFRGLNDDSKTILHVMIKSIPVNLAPGILEMSQILFERELCVYERLFPVYRSLDTNLSIDKLIPECFHLNPNLDEAVLVLADMRHEGFERCRNKMFLDFDHMAVSLRSLAKLHALSIISQEKEVISLESLQLPPYKKTFDIYVEIVKEGFVNHCDLFADTKYNGFLSRIKNNVKNIFLTCVETLDAKCVIVGHGDYWRENILFEYEDGKPFNSCMVDFQGARQMRPGHDVLNFIVGNADPDTRRQNLQKFLDIYHNALSEYLSSNGVRPEAYTRTDLEDDIKYLAPASFTLLFYAFSLWFGLNQDTMVDSKLKLGSSNEKKEAEEKFKELVAGVLEDLQHFGYISCTE